MKPIVYGLAGEQWALRRKTEESIRILRDSGRPFLRNEREDPQRRRWRKTTPAEKKGLRRGQRKRPPQETTPQTLRGLWGRFKEEERIALDIEGKGEFLSEELKKLLREIEVVQGLRAGALG